MTKRGLNSHRNRKLSKMTVCRLDFSLIITRAFDKFYYPNRSDEGLTLETSAFLSFTVANLRFNSVVENNYLLYSPTNAAHSFFRNLPPLFYWKKLWPLHLLSLEGTPIISSGQYFCKGNLSFSWNGKRDLCRFLIW